MTFLERYQQGDHAAVWAELDALGDAVRARKLRADAEAVAAETMRRARANLKTLNAFQPPPKRTPDLLKQLEKRAGGKLPLSLVAWYTLIGAATHPELTVFPLDLAALYTPPPPFFPPKGAWETSIEAWRRQLVAEGLPPAAIEEKLQPAIAEFEAQDLENERLAALPFDPRPRLPLTPDDLARKGIKDGAFDVLLPQPTADFPLNGQPFVTFLRQTFHNISQDLLPL